MKCQDFFPVNILFLKNENRMSSATVLFSGLRVNTVLILFPV